MTLDIWDASTVKSTTQVPCHRRGCIIFYASEDCLLCDAAWEVLLEAIADLGLAASIVEKVDITDCSPDELRSSGNYILPTIKTCDMELTGFPDVDTVRTAILQSMMKGCFSFVQASSHH